MPDENPPKSRSRDIISGAFGAGLVLIVLPCFALIARMSQLSNQPTVGLPILAVFGIMTLFGALALIASLYSGLDLTDKNQPLGLPEGSIRAAIALSLIVLFAIIAIMLHQTLSKPYVISEVPRIAKNRMMREMKDKLIAVVPECPVAKPNEPAPDCTTPASFAFHVQQPPLRESADLAKQLLILIGTLMTSVTSFYFAAVGNDAAQQRLIDALTNGTKEPSSPSAANGTTTANVATDDHADGCNVAITDPTADEDLPPATGGVERV